MIKSFGKLEEFKGRDVVLYRSSDLNNTAIYFTNVKDKDRKTAEAYFELLKFKYHIGEHQIYLKYPNTDYYVEMVDGGSGSSRGNMEESSGKNIWEISYKSPFTIFSHDENLLIKFGRKDWSGEFNFMKKIASYNKGNPYNLPYPNETFNNFDEIEKALSLEYLKIPEDVRKIQYCCKTKDNIYFLIDCPAYNFQYENHRFFIIINNIVTELKIISFDRYKDGGTTYIKVLDSDNIEHVFYYPTTLGGKKDIEKYDNIELFEVSKEEKDFLIKLLNIELEPKENENL